MIDSDGLLVSLPDDEHQKYRILVTPPRVMEGEQRLHTDLIPAEECVALPSVEDPRSVSVYVDALTSRFLTPDEDDCCVLPRSLEIKSCSIILKSAVSSCRRRHHPGGAVFSGAAG